MNKVLLSFRRFPVAIFCTLTLLLTFAVYFSPVPREAIPFAAALAPAVVALALVALFEGRAGVRSLLSPLARWRIAPKWVMVALALAFAMRLAIGILAQAMGLLPNLQLLPANPVQAIVLALVYLVAAVPEELGWRAFALSRLLRERSPLLAGLLLGLPWGLIHVVLHLPGMWAEGLPWLPTVVQLVSLSLIITWLFVSSGQNLLLLILFHAAQSTFGYGNEGLTPLHIQWLMTAVWSATAMLAAVVMVATPRLRGRPLPAA